MKNIGGRSGRIHSAPPVHSSLFPENSSTKTPITTAMMIRPSNPIAMASLFVLLAHENHGEYGTDEEYEDKQRDDEYPPEAHAHEMHPPFSCIRCSGQLHTLFRLFRT
ncbi:MAG TPA: hypothetical protein VM223_05315, partial [Planctomycetota bacterium]|nr:hypothetical protein [Planctomycetota bacterium]